MKAQVAAQRRQMGGTDAAAKEEQAVRFLCSPVLGELQHRLFHGVTCTWAVLRAVRHAALCFLRSPGAAGCRGARDSRLGELQWEWCAAQNRKSEMTVS